MKTVWPLAIAAAIGYGVYLFLVALPLGDLLRDVWGLRKNPGVGPTSVGTIVEAALGIACFFGSLSIISKFRKKL